MITYKDFVPKQLRKQGGIKPPLYETFQEAVTAAGGWMREQEVTVINIETVVLPALWKKGNPLNGAGSLPATAYGYDVATFQFVRVWYQLND